MALIVGGTTVTGTQTLDATKLTGNLPALNGSSLTNLPAATLAFNAVGSYTIACKTSTNMSAGATTAAGPTFQGKDLTGAELGNIYSGTWRNMGGFLNTGRGMTYQRQS